MRPNSPTRRLLSTINAKAVEVSLDLVLTTEDDIPLTTEDLRKLEREHD